jgi:hypothetical protein
MLPILVLVHSVHLLLVLVHLLKRSALARAIAAIAAVLAGLWLYVKVLVLIAAMCTAMAVYMLQAAAAGQVADPVPASYYTGRPGAPLPHVGNCIYMQPDSGCDTDY